MLTTIISQKMLADPATAPHLSMANTHHVVLIDPSIGSRNVGDAIIADAVEREVLDTLPEAYIQRFSTHQLLGAQAFSSIRRSDLVLVGGTNLLSGQLSAVGWKNQWHVSPSNSLLFRRKQFVLFGTGWSTYEERSNFISKFVFRNYLAGTIPHVVRDSYTEKKLKEIGVEQVRMLGCPTLWSLTPDHVSSIDRTSATRCVTTLTCYRRDPEADTAMLNSLKDQYGKVYLWLQGLADAAYVRDLTVEGVEVLPSNLRVYDDLLSEGDIDYVGTRLHGGIRALQHGRRALIVSVDNRATEMGRDFGLPVLERAHISSLPDRLSNGEWGHKIRVPVADITDWKRVVRERIGAE